MVFGKIKQGFNQMKMMQRMMKDENFKRLLEHPKMQALMKDPEMMKLLKEQNPAKIASNPKLMTMMRDPELVTLFQKVDFKALMG
jgi:hypothetical protein